MQRGSTISALAIASLALVLSSTSWATALNVNIHVQPPIVNAPAKTLPGYASTRGVHPLKDQPCQHAAGCGSTPRSTPSGPNTPPGPPGGSPPSWGPQLTQ
jgi:hypothetical protein